MYKLVGFTLDVFWLSSISAVQILFVLYMMVKLISHLSLFITLVNSYCEVCVGCLDMNRWIKD
jgi:hypothetical protein